MGFLQWATADNSLLDTVDLAARIHNQYSRTRLWHTIIDVLISPSNPPPLLSALVETMQIFCDIMLCTLQLLATALVAALDSAKEICHILHLTIIACRDIFIGGYAIIYRLLDLIASSETLVIATCCVVVVIVAWKEGSVPLVNMSRSVDLMGLGAVVFVSWIVGRGGL